MLICRTQITDRSCGIASTLLFSNSAHLRWFPLTLCGSLGGSTLEGYACRKDKQKFLMDLFFYWEGHSFSEFSPSIPGRLSSNPGTRKDTRSGWYWLLARSLDSHVSYSAFLLWSQGRPAMLLKGSQKENTGICCSTQRALGKTTKP